MKDDSFRTPHAHPASRMDSTFSISKIKIEQNRLLAVALQHTKILVLCSILVLASIPFGVCFGQQFEYSVGGGTTIIATVGKDSIVLAADSKTVIFEFEKSTGNVRKSEGTECKIRRSQDLIIAGTGFLSGSLKTYFGHTYTFNVLDLLSGADFKRFATLEEKVRQCEVLLDADVRILSANLSGKVDSSKPFLTIIIASFEGKVPRLAFIEYSMKSYIAPVFAHTQFNTSVKSPVVPTTADWSAFTTVPLGSLGQPVIQTNHEISITSEIQKLYSPTLGISSISESLVKPSSSVILTSIVNQSLESKPELLPGSILDSKDFTWGKSIPSNDLTIDNSLLSINQHNALVPNPVLSFTYEAHSKETGSNLISQLVTTTESKQTISVNLGDLSKNLSSQPTGVSSYSYGVEGLFSTINNTTPITMGKLDWSILNSTTTIVCDTSRLKVINGIQTWSPANQIKFNSTDEKSIKSLTPTSTLLNRITNNGSLAVSSTQSQLGADYNSKITYCRSSQVSYKFGETVAIDDMFNDLNGNATTLSISIIKKLINIEITDPIGSQKVGHPIDIIAMTRNGSAWIQVKQACR